LAGQEDMYIDQFAIAITPKYEKEVEISQPLPDSEAPPEKISLE